MPQSLSSALAAGIKQSSSTDSVPSYGRVGEREAGGAPRPDGKPAQYGGGQQQQRSPGPLLAKADNLGYNNGGSGYSGYQGGKASQGFPGSGYPGGFDRQPSGGYSAGSNGLSGSYGRGGSGWCCSSCRRRVVKRQSGLRHGVRCEVARVYRRWCRVGFGAVVHCAVECCGALCSGVLWCTGLR